jgi:hypothetical protein
MLDFCKLILEKVSFDSFLFEKELKKSIAYLLPEEGKELLDWVHQNFGDKYSEIINSIQNLL